MEKIPWRKTEVIAVQTIHDYIREHPQAVVMGPVPLTQVMERLKQEYHGEELPLEVLPPYLQRMHRENACCYARDEHIDLPPEAVRLRLLRIPVTEALRRYTAKDFTAWTVRDAKDREGIYVVYEETAGWFYCNSSMLHLELTLARGISAPDYHDQTEKYSEYMGLMRRYLQDYTHIQIS